MSLGSVLGDIAGAPLKGLVEAVGGIIDNVSTTDDERAKARLALRQVELDFQAKELEARTALLHEQSAIVQAEVKSESWAARNWRPILMLAFGYVIVHTLVLQPLFGLPPVVLPEHLWTLLQYGMTGYIGGRTLEKVTPVVADAVAAYASAKQAQTASAAANAGVLAGAVAAAAQARK